MFKYLTFSNKIFSFFAFTSYKPVLGSDVSLGIPIKFTRYILRN